MKASELLKKILTDLASKKVKLAQAILDNGTILEAESFETGNEVFIVTEDERIPLPVGEYTMEDGRILSVTEEGVINEVKGEAPAEEVAIEAEDVAVEVEAPAEIAAEIAEVIEAVVEVIAPMIEEVKEEMKKIREEMGTYKEKMSKQPSQRPIKHAPAAPQKENVHLAQGRAMSTLDRVMAKISK